MDFFDDSSDDGLSLGGALLSIFGVGFVPYLAWTLGFQHGKDVASLACRPAVAASAPAASAASAPLSAASIAAIAIRKD